MCSIFSSKSSMTKSSKAATPAAGVGAADASREALAMQAELAEARERHRRTMKRRGKPPKSPTAGSPPTTTRRPPPPLRRPPTLTELPFAPPSFSEATTATDSEAVGADNSPSATSPAATSPVATSPRAASADRRSSTSTSKHRRSLALAGAPFSYPKEFDCDQAEKAFDEGAECPPKQNEGSPGGENEQPQNPEHEHAEPFNAPTPTVPPVPKRPSMERPKPLKPKPDSQRSDTSKASSPKPGMPPLPPKPTTSTSKASSPTVPPLSLESTALQQVHAEPFTAPPPARRPPTILDHELELQQQQHIPASYASTVMSDSMASSWGSPGQSPLLLGEQPDVADQMFAQHKPPHVHIPESTSDAQQPHANGQLAHSTDTTPSGPGGPAQAAPKKRGPPHITKVRNRGWQTNIAPVPTARARARKLQRAMGQSQKFDEEELDKGYEPSSPSASVSSDKPDGVRFQRSNTVSGRIGREKTSVGKRTVAGRHRSRSPRLSSAQKTKSIASPMSAGRVRKASTSRKPKRWYSSKTLPKNHRAILNREQTEISQIEVTAPDEVAAASKTAPRSKQPPKTKTPRSPVFSFKKKKEREPMPWEKNVNTYETLLLATEFNKVNEKEKEKRNTPTNASQAQKQQQQQQRRSPSTSIEEVDPKSLSTSGALKHQQEDAWSSLMPDPERMRESMRRTSTSSMVSDASTASTSSMSISRSTLAHPQIELLPVVPPAEAFRPASPKPKHTAPAPPGAGGSADATKSKGNHLMPQPHPESPRRSLPTLPVGGALSPPSFPRDQKFYSQITMYENAEEPEAEFDPTPAMPYIDSPKSLYGGSVHDFSQSHVEAQSQPGPISPQYDSQQASVEPYLDAPQNQFTLQPPMSDALDRAPTHSRVQSMKDPFTPSPSHGQLPASYHEPGQYTQAPSQAGSYQEDAVQFPQAQSQADLYQGDVHYVNNNFQPPPQQPMYTSPSGAPSVSNGYSPEPFYPQQQQQIPAHQQPMYTSPSGAPSVNNGYSPEPFYPQQQQSQQPMYSSPSSTPSVSNGYSPEPFYPQQQQQQSQQPLYTSPDSQSSQLSMYHQAPQPFNRNSFDSNAAHQPQMSYSNSSFAPPSQPSEEAYQPTQRYSPTPSQAMSPEPFYQTSVPYSPPAFDPPPDSHSTASSVPSSQPPGYTSTPTQPHPPATRPPPQQHQQQPHPPMSLEESLFALSAKASQRAPSVAGEISDGEWISDSDTERSKSRAATRSKPKPRTATEKSSTSTNDSEKAPPHSRTVSAPPSADASNSSGKATAATSKSRRARKTCEPLIDRAKTHAEIKSTFGVVLRRSGTSKNIGGGKTATGAMTVPRSRSSVLALTSRGGSASASASASSSPRPSLTGRPHSSVLSKKPTAVKEVEPAPKAAASLATVTASTAVNKPTAETEPEPAPKAAPEADASAAPASNESTAEKTPADDAKPAAATVASNEKPPSTEKSPAASPSEDKTSASASSAPAADEKPITTIADLFESLNIPAGYAAALEEEELVLGDLVSLDSDELKELLPKMGPRKRLQRWIKEQQA